MKAENKRPRVTRADRMKKDGHQPTTSGSNIDQNQTQNGEDNTALVPLDNEVQQPLTQHNNIMETE